MVMWASIATSRACKHVGRLAAASTAARRELAATSGTGALRSFLKDKGILEKENHVVLHCGVAWSGKSQETRARLAQWADTDGITKDVICATINVENAPEFIMKQGIRSIPTLLLLQGGKTKHRVDGADVGALEEFLTGIDMYTNGVRPAPSTDPKCETDPLVAFARAQELQLEETDSSLEHAVKLYQQVLQGGSEVQPFAFQVRVGILDCAVKRLVAKDSKLELAKDVCAALSDLRTSHRLELDMENAGADTGKVTKLIAHAELLSDAFSGNVTGEEHDILQLYAAHDDKKPAMKAALSWYQKQAAAHNMLGLMQDYCLTNRSIPDKEGSLPGFSVFADEPFLSSMEMHLGTQHREHCFADCSVR